MHTQDDREYDDNANFDDVFETKHVVQAIEDIQITAAYNNNYKLYFGDEYHEFNQMSQKCVENERVSTNTIQSHPPCIRTQNEAIKAICIVYLEANSYDFMLYSRNEIQISKSKDSINKF